MNEKRGGGGLNPRLLVLIPAVLMMVRAMHRRSMWQHGHHGWADRMTAEGDSAGSYRLPPKIDRILTSWHERAHQATDAGEAPPV